MKLTISQLRRLIREVVEEQADKIISLLYSDNQVGTHEYGFIPRKSGEDPDDEDRRYQRHLKSQGLEARVWDGKAKIFGA